MTTLTTDPSPRLRAALTPPDLPTTGWFGALRHRFARQRQHRTLQSLPPELLRDMGLSPADIELLRAADAPLIR